MFGGTLTLFGCSGDWYGRMAMNANFYKNELSLNANIYRYYINCFSRRASYRPEVRVQVTNRTCSGACQLGRNPIVLIFFLGFHQ